MAAAEKTHGKRLLDFLDIHYYFQPDTSSNNDTAKALRLRMTRSLWVCTPSARYAGSLTRLQDTTYVDESWIGSSPQNHQWNPTVVELIPRFRTLIDINYPGTKLSISEFSSSADTDITGGLVTVDALGIFGQQKLDSATYWVTPDELGPVGLAYWLFRGCVFPLPPSLFFLISCDVDAPQIRRALRRKQRTGQPRDAEPRHAGRIRGHREREAHARDREQEPRHTDLVRAREHAVWLVLHAALRRRGRHCQVAGA